MGRWESDVIYVVEWGKGHLDIRRSHSEPEASLSYVTKRIKSQAALKDVVWPIYSLVF